ncbi:FkbM family methyltransferase [Falsirhodobacter deserti]|uniref:FkbM family methyltransferase n=1 Tax=Falsirhodobacter deserti TaxID=1365611 RepID=UPI000FE32314|nr:FkbM family methyltransferase [Falsirhodobacter deserti]
MTTDTPLMLHGLRVPITEADVSPIIWRAMQSGEYEAKEARSVRSLLHAGDRVLELGSGLGIITSIMAQTPGVRIWSFDANPHLIALSRRIAEANGIENATFEHGLLSAGAPENHVFYIRRDFWMSSMLEMQGPYETTISVQSSNLDDFIEAQSVNVLVMDIEGAERDLLSAARLDGVDCVFLELHDHLYGLAGVRSIFASMDRLGFSYDPRGSSGPCVLFRRDDGQIRPYEG